MDEFRLGIGLPLTDKSVPTSFLDSWVTLEKPSFVYLRPIYNGPIDEIRNQLVRQAIDSKCSHLLMCDTDQTYASDTIIKLLSHNLPVVGCMVHRRYPPFDPLLFRGVPGSLTRIPDEELEKRDLIEVNAMGTGVMLYNMDVFKNIEQPWFENTIGEDGKPVGEDIGFCHKLKNAGYKIFADCSIDIGHLATLVVNYDTYKIYKMLKQQNNSSEV